MSDIGKILTRLSGRRNGQDLVDALKSAAFGAVGQIHRQAQGLSINERRLHNKLQALEKALCTANKLEPELIILLKGTTSQKAIAITQACVVR